MLGDLLRFSLLILHLGPCLEVEHSMIKSNTFFQCGPSFPMSTHSHLTSFTWQIDIPIPFTIFATLLRFIVYKNQKIKRGRPGSKAILHPHNNVMLHDQVCTQCFEFAQREHFGTNSVCENVYSIHHDSKHVFNHRRVCNSHSVMVYISLIKCAVIELFVTMAVAGQVHLY